MVGLSGLLLSSVFTTSVSASSSKYHKNYSSSGYYHDKNHDDYDYSDEEYSYDNTNYSCDYSYKSSDKNYNDMWKKFHDDMDSYYKKGDWNNYNKTLSDMNNMCWEEWNSGTYGDSHYEEYSYDSSYDDENCYYDYDYNSHDSNYDDSSYSY
jgi:hypothetical protein